MFFVIGIGFTLMTSVLFLRWAWWKKVAMASLVLVIFLLVLLLIWGGNPGVINRGDASWWNTTPGKEIILLVAMIAGMFLRVTWDVVDEYQKKKRIGNPSSGPVFSVWDFASPAIISLLVFQPVLSIGEGQPMSIKLALFSLQNGFFWNTIYAKIKQSKAK
jgi:hypothetical protein